jgi:hypothetical protein
VYRDIPNPSMLSTDMSPTSIDMSASYGSLIGGRRDDGVLALSSDRYAALYEGAPFEILAWSRDAGRFLNNTISTTTADKERRGHTQGMQDATPTSISDSNSIS